MVSQKEERAVAIAERINKTLVAYTVCQAPTVAEGWTIKGGTIFYLRRDCRGLGAVLKSNAIHVHLSACLNN